MKLIKDNFRLRDFNAWMGAVDTKNIIIKNDKEDDFNFLIEELFEDGLTETELNDLLWFDDEYILEQLGINEYDN